MERAVRAVRAIRYCTADMRKNIISYKDLIVWQKSIDLAVAVYTLTDHFPQDEKFGLASQMRRAAVSISSNIAEGKSRNSKKEYSHFVRISYGSASELETQIIISKKLTFSDKLDYSEVDSLLLEVLKMLGTILSKLKT